MGGFQFISVKKKKKSLEVIWKPVSKQSWGNFFSKQETMIQWKIIYDGEVFLDQPTSLIPSHMTGY